MNLALIDLTERRRAAKRADLMARIAQAIPPREDDVRYGAIHWKRHPEHLARVLRVVARREDGMRGRGL